MNKVMVTLILSMIVYAITLLLDSHHFVLWGLIISVVATTVLFLLTERENDLIRRELDDEQE